MDAIKQRMLAGLCARLRMRALCEPRARDKPPAVSVLVLAGVLCALLAPSRVLASTFELPHPNQLAPLVANADGASRWRMGSHEVWVLRAQRRQGGVGDGLEPHQQVGLVRRLVAARRDGVARLDAAVDDQSGPRPGDARGGRAVDDGLLQRRRQRGAAQGEQRGEAQGRLELHDDDLSRVC